MDPAKRLGEMALREQADRAQMIPSEVGIIRVIITAKRSRRVNNVYSMLPTPCKVPVRCVEHTAKKQDQDPTDRYAVRSGDVQVPKCKISSLVQAWLLDVGRHVREIQLLDTLYIQVRGIDNN
jgi:hypothetical protein